MPGRRRNLEIKAIDPDPQATLRAALELGADDEGWLHQRDTYFHAVQGRLKLREAPPEPAELIAYARAELAGPKVSLYRVVQVADHDALIEALSESLGVKVVVEKARRLLRWRNVRIHLDRVEGLGDFVELEAVAASPGGLEVERDRVEELRTTLGIADEHLVAHGYADLLAQRGPGRSARLVRPGRERRGARTK
jgi:adenylate cyclase class IV